MTKRGKLAILGALILVVVLLIGVSVFRNAKSGSSNLAGVPVQGVAGIADYRLIPIIDAQSDDIKQVYLNTEATPALFFSTSSDESQKKVAEIQDKINEISTNPHKPLVLVSTFVKTTDQAKAISEAKAFQQEYEITLPIAIQVGSPTVFVKQVPSLVYTDHEGSHIVTDENEILDSLDEVLAFPSSQSTTPVEK